MNNKGQLSLNVLTAAAIAFIVLAAVLFMGGRILEETSETMCNDDGGYYTGSECYKDSNAYNNESGFSNAVNITTGGSDAILEFAGWQETLVIVIVAVVIIGILMTAFRQK